MNVDLRQGDCLKLLPTLATDSVDLVFCDPPYGTTDLALDASFSKFGWPRLNAELRRVLKPTGWFFVFFPPKYLPIFLRAWQYRWEYICLKHNGSPGQHNTVRPVFVHENLWAFCQIELSKYNDLYFDKVALRTRGAKYKRRAAKHAATEFRTANRFHASPAIDNPGYREGTTVLAMDGKTAQPVRERNAHPTQKPLDLARTIVKAYCPPGGTVLDPFAGSGTHVLAAATQGRNAVGFELDPEYYRIARGRLDGRLDGGVFA